MRRLIITMLSILVILAPAVLNYYTGFLGDWRPYQIITYCSPQYITFTSISTNDNEGSLLDVGQISAFITDGEEYIVITINNAYPGYEGYVDFTIQNTSGGQAEITGIITDNTHADCLELEITGEWQSDPILDADDTREGHLLIIITDQAAQNTIYSFSISINAEQYGDLKSPMSFGGFGGGPTYYIDTNFFGVEDRYRISYDGVLLETIEFTSDDGTFIITIPEGTMLLDKDGKRLEILEVEINEDPPPPPEDSDIIGLSYKFGPGGVSFNPPFDLIIYYDLEELSDDVTSVYVAYYDEIQGWIKLGRISGFIAELGTVTAEVSHLTSFAIICDIIPAQIVLPVPLIEEEEEEIVVIQETKELLPLELAGVIVPVKHINWLLIIIAASIVLICLVVLYYYRRRRRTSSR